MAPSHLPEFDNPPVSEVAISVVFDPLTNWHAPHAGVYWSRINTRYPKTEVKPPMPPQFEQFGNARWQQPTVRIVPADLDAQRFWFISEPANYLVQLQRDRFTINWRKLSDNDVYPRYNEGLRLRFSNEWKQFKEFLHDQHIAEPIVKQCEVAYVNDILLGDGCSTLADALDMFSPWWKSCSDDFLPPPDTLTVTGAFPMPNETGRLSFSAQHIRRERDSREAIQFSLVAKNRPFSNDRDDVLKAIDVDREWVVRGFASLTSPRAHTIWKRTI